MDYDILHSYLIKRFDKYRSGLMFWWNKTESIITENNQPYLKQSYLYWDTAINFQVDHRIPRRNSYCGTKEDPPFYYCYTKEMEANLPGAFVYDYK